MKNIKTKIGVFAASCALLFAISCSDYLEILPTGELRPDQVASLAGIDASLLSVYSQVNGRNLRMASPSNWVWGSIRGGDANKGTDPGDFNTINPVERFETDVASAIVAENWRGVYEGVARANNVMRLLLTKGPDVTDADVVRISAQARFLRGHFYFQLKRNFNNTPYVDETVDYENGIDEVKNDKDLWPFIEADFKYAVDNLPETQSEVGRVNSWAAKAYLAKVYVYQEKWNEAKALYDDIIEKGVTSNGKKYDLVPYYDDAFRGENDNHEESVWAYQSAAGTGSVNNANPEFDLNFPYQTLPGNCCGFFAPSFTFVNSFRTDAKGLPLLDGGYNDEANRVKNDMGLESTDSFTPDTGNLDPRLDHTVGRRGLPYLDWGDHRGKAWIREQSWAGPYSPKKYVYEKSEQGTFQDNSSWTPGYTGINIMIIRFADVLLMAAEAEIEATGGSLDKAREYVNRVRQRAVDSKLLRDGGTMAANYVIGLYESPWLNKEMAREAVRFERKLELGMEGHRFYDLVRWGTIQEEMDAYFALEGKLLSTQFGGAKYTDKHKLLPIPQNQIDLLGSDILDQNPGF